MAIGAALLFNIRLPINFNSPLKATSIIYFWQRWHITLSNFITIYIYTPIVRSFKNLTFHKAMFATIITFLVAGLWHGASWMFVMFGGLHGFGLIINHYWKNLKIKMNKVLGWFFTFNFVNITFVFFRANEWDDAVKVLGSMFSLNNVVLPNFVSSKFSFLADYGFEFGKWLENTSGDIWSIVWIFSGFILVLYFKNSIKMIESYKVNAKNALFSTFLIICSILSLTSVSEFLYFNF